MNGDGQDEIQGDTVRALFRHEQKKAGEWLWNEVRELTVEEWEAVTAAHREVYSFTRGLDGFVCFAWGDLRNVRDELLRQVLERPSLDDWLPQLIEYRILNFSTALKLYDEHVSAQVNRTGNDQLAVVVRASFPNYTIAASRIDWSIPYGTPSNTGCEV
ncbi:hypothetical protein [Arthrobacter sp. SW1]|uniref:hypothetical protein n=1 Tax=Arthrobacter sp. SW1 TaxID=1920889 RepID=UPI0011130EC2|nr:hypothetical protein [Arthrobacter sp. SW1]